MWSCVLVETICSRSYRLQWDNKHYQCGLFSWNQLKFTTKHCSVGEKSIQHIFFKVTKSGICPKLCSTDRNKPDSVTPVSNVSQSNEEDHPCTSMSKLIFLPEKLARWIGSDGTVSVWRKQRTCPWPQTKPHWNNRDVWCCRFPTSRLHPLGTVAWEKNKQQTWFTVNAWLCSHMAVVSFR